MNKLWIMVVMACFMAQTAYASVIWPSSVDGLLPDFNKKPKQEQEVTPQPGEDILLYSDDDYKYIMNTGSVKKMQHPYLNSEELIDVWVKVEGNANGIVYYPVNYTMQHYYMRLNQPQIQLLTSIEYNSSSQPYVAVDRRYIEDAWREIVPMSSEEACYFAVLEHILHK